MIRLVPAALAALCLVGCDSAPIAKAKSRISERLKDPSSAKFKDVSVCSNDDTVIRGDLNAKNAYGAYTGFKPFFHSGYITVFSDDVEYELWREWNIKCFGPEIVTKTDEMIERAKAEAAAGN